MFKNEFERLMNRIQDALDTNHVYEVRKEYHRFERFCRGHHRLLSHLIRHLKASRYGNLNPVFKFDVEATIPTLERVSAKLFELVGGEISSIMMESSDTISIKECFSKKVRPLVASIETQSRKIERHARLQIKKVRSEIKNSQKFLADLEAIEADLEDFD